MKKKMLFVATTIVALSGCAGSKDYTPAAGASGKDIFAQACIGCHGPVSDTELTTFWEITTENASAAYITAKINQGSMRMPSFPNIKGAELEAITTFVLEHNKSQ
ncbi:MAG: cytochrome c [Gammaproteobacteria bacterium]|nr:cytochrome c [Gammaproteobacteria bacterium]